MSRIRIVGGTITKTSKGAYNMYSDENIVHSSGKSISEVGEENGITFGEPKDAPKVPKIKKILTIKWMCSKMENEIMSAMNGETVSLLVKTLNYKEGETINIVIDEIDGKDIKSNTKEIIFSGEVKKDGNAELKEKITI